jgi:hypothetical protein
MNRGSSITLIVRVLLFLFVVMLAGNGKSYAQQSAAADPGLITMASKYS